MNLIDRYVYAVTEHLPANTKEDVSKELRANIMDMLPENPSEDEIKAVLNKLGNPIKLAHEYSQSKSYLIGPELYDGYITVLKIVVTVLVCVLVGVAIINMIFNSGDKSPVDILVSFFTNIISAVVQGVSQAFLWVTVSFVIVERCGVKNKDLPFNNKDWSVNDLKEVEITTNKKISPIESIAGLIFTIVFTAIFYFQPSLFGYYAIDNGISTIEPVFVMARLNIYMPFIIGFALFQLCIFVYKIIAKKWSYPLVISIAVYNISSFILTVLMLNDKLLFNLVFFTKVGEIFKVTGETVTSYIWPNSINIFLSILGVLLMIDIGQSLYKCIKK